MNGAIDKNICIPTRRYLAATVIPVALFYFSILLLINNISNQYEFTKKEIRGVSVISQLHDSIVELQKIRGLSAISLNESNNINEQVKTLQYGFNETFTRLTFDDNLGKIVSPAELEGVKEKVDRLFKRDPFTMNKENLFSEYTETITLLKQTIRIAADRSNLTLDPELDSYYMMSLISTQFPEIIELLGRVRGIGSALIAGTNISDEEKGQLLGHLAVLRVGLENMKNTGAVIYSASPELEKVLLEWINRADEKAYFFINTTNAAINGTNRLSPTQYFELGTETITAYLAPYRMTGKMLTSHLHERAGRLQRLRNISITGTLLAAVLIIYFAYSFYKYNKNMFEQVEVLSITDMLTGLYNRRYFHMLINQELMRAQRDKKSFSLAIIDVDFFKPYNDTYGHVEGDRALVEVGKSLKESLKRAGDFVFRIGGEEFCFFFAGESREATLAITEEIRRDIETLGIKHRVSSVSPVLTISTGIVYLDEMKNMTCSDLMKSADEALYRAKTNGRNRSELVDLS